MWSVIKQLWNKLFGKGTASVFNLSVSIPREQLLRTGRILLVDDERPDLIDDLENDGFSIDYLPDLKKTDMNRITSGRYDLLILDFGAVGSDFGDDEGLELLRISKRTNPAMVVLAYTSKALPSNLADFYRLADNVLNKDAGIRESFEKIEEALNKAKAISNLWPAFLNVKGVATGSKEDYDLQKAYMKALGSQDDLKAFKMLVSAKSGKESRSTIGDVVVDKLIEFGLKATIGA